MGGFISRLIEFCLKPDHIDDDVSNSFVPLENLPSEDSLIISDDDTFGTDIPLDDLDNDDDDEPISLVETSEEEDTNEFIYSYTNEKQGLLIGINYNEDDFKNDDLNGCVNDMNNLKSFLINKCHFFDGDITTLCNGEATRENIEDELSKLVVFSHENPGSEIWLSYSGHGSNITSFTEDDLKSEVICPCDYSTNGIITDEWIQDNFVKGLEKTTKVFVLMDCCNSGSNLNLPYRLKLGEVSTQDTNYTKEEIDNLCYIVKISGCEDDQTSADYFERSENEFQGALTNGFLYFSNKVNTNHNNITFFYNNVVSYLTYRGFTQHPVLSFSKSELLDSKLFKY